LGKETGSFDTIVFIWHAMNALSFCTLLYNHQIMSRHNPNRKSRKPAVAIPVQKAAEKPHPASGYARKKLTSGRRKGPSDQKIPTQALVIIAVFILLVIIFVMIFNR
jgi:hypothetical protein